VTRNNMANRYVCSLNKYGGTHITKAEKNKIKNRLPHQDCQIFLSATYPNGENIPSGRKIYKWPQNVPNGSKIDQKVIKYTKRS
jgi:hypothetical protein